MPNGNRRKQKRPLGVMKVVTLEPFGRRGICQKVNHLRGGEWYLEKRGSRKILARSRNLGNVFDKSRSLVFSWFVFTFFESRNFSPKSLGLGFLTRISASRRVSDFTIRHPSFGASNFENTMAPAILERRPPRWVDLKLLNCFSQFPQVNTNSDFTVALNNRDHRSAPVGRLGNFCI